VAEPIDDGAVVTDPTQGEAPPRLSRRRVSRLGMAGVVAAAAILALSIAHAQAVGRDHHKASVQLAAAGARLQAQRSATHRAQDLLASTMLVASSIRPPATKLAAAVGGIDDLYQQESALDAVFLADAEAGHWDAYNAVVDPANALRARRFAAESAIDNQVENFP
jgi:hypothetical protein